MPAELVHAVAVTSVIVLLHLPPHEEEDGHRLKVKRAIFAEIFEKETATPSGYIFDYSVFHSHPFEPSRGLQQPVYPTLDISSTFMFTNI